MTVEVILDLMKNLNLLFTNHMNSYSSLVWNDARLPERPGHSGWVNKPVHSVFASFHVIRDPVEK